MFSRNAQFSAFLTREKLQKLYFVVQFLFFSGKIKCIIKVDNKVERKICKGLRRWKRRHCNEQPEEKIIYY